MGRRRVVAGVLSVAVVLTGGCSDKDSGKQKSGTTTTAKGRSKPTTTVKQITASMTAWKVLTLDGQFAAFVEEAKKAGLDTKLDKDGDYSVFAPNATAYAALPADERAALDAADAGLQVVVGRHTFGELREMNGQRLETIDGRGVEVTVNGADVSIGGALIQKSDIAADNGTLFVLDHLSKPAG